MRSSPLTPLGGTVTLQLVNGFSFGRPVWYLTMDSSDPTVAAIQGATYAPLLGKLPTGGDDSFNSPIERIFIADNGELDCANPQRQGLDAAITDGFRPNNTLAGSRRLLSTTARLGTSISSNGRRPRSRKATASSCARSSKF